MELKQNEDLNIKNDNNTKQNIKQKKKINKKTKKILLIIILIAVIILASILLYKYFSKDKLSYYENKMIEYGLADKYNNNTPNDEENVTKSEAVKMILEAILNGENIDNYISVDRSYYYDNFIWVNYAKVSKIIDYDYINEDDENQNITCIETIKIFYTILQGEYISSENINVAVNDTDIKIKNKDEYSEEEMSYIKEVIMYGILPNNYKYSKDKILTKEIFNKMLVNFMENYNLKK